MFVYNIKIKSHNKWIIGYDSDPCNMISERWQVTVTFALLLSKSDNRNDTTTFVWVVCDRFTDNSHLVVTVYVTQHM